MKLFLIRHAKAEGNNYSDASITQKGIEQCARLTKYLSFHVINKVYCSTMLRAKDTLEHLKPALAGADIKFTELIKERCKGIYEKKSDKEFIDAFKKSGLRGREFRSEGGENFYDVFERSKKFLERLKHEKYKNIVIISHGEFIAASLMYLLGISYDDLKFIKINNASVTLIELDNNFNIKSFNINNCDHFLKYK